MFVSTRVAVALLTVAIAQGMQQPPGGPTGPTPIDRLNEILAQRKWNQKRTTNAQRKAAAARAKAAREMLAARRLGQKSANTRSAAAEGGNLAVSVPGGTPDYFGLYSNWANSPRLTKFVDTLPRLGVANNLGQMLPVAVADTVSYPGSDYYEISAVEYSEKMHSELPPTRLRGYVQTNRGTNTAACGGSTPLHGGA